MRRDRHSPDVRPIQSHLPRLPWLPHLPTLPYLPHQAHLPDPPHLCPTCPSIVDGALVPARRSYGLGPRAPCVSLTRGVPHDAVTMPLAINKRDQNNEPVNVWPCLSP